MIKKWIFKLIFNKVWNDWIIEYEKKCKECENLKRRIKELTTYHN